MSRVSARQIGLYTVCGAWMAWAVWSQFLSIPTGEVENHSSLSVRERMNDCSGNFQQRYDCKNTIVIETDRMTFLNMIGRIVIVVLPPLLLIGALNFAGRRRDDDDIAGGSGGSDEWSSPTHYRRRYHRRTSSRHD